MSELRIERLDPTHVRGGFDCGKPSLDNFLLSLANQYEKRNIGRTYVATEGDDRRVLGYYTLASGALAFQNLPDTVSRKLPKHPVPVVLLARLAVDNRAQGRGLGGKLLRDGITRSLDLSQKLGIHAIVVDAIDESAKAFYVKYGFSTLLDHDWHLFLPIATAQAAIGKA
jgi:ribosomal protein S18 acetylase RimI-like enzyme